MVDRESTGWQDSIQGMLPLISTDTFGEMKALIDAGLANGKFACSDNGTLCSTDMAADQDVSRFFELTNELEGLRESLAHTDGKESTPT